MRRILSIIPAFFSIALLAFSLYGRPAANAAGFPSGSADSVQDLKAQIERLQRQVSDMQRRISDLESRRLSPGTPYSPERMPPGSRPRWFNGMQYWLIPVESNPGVQK